ncbi:MAG: DUF4390 domain-containing protein [Thiohalomonadaceae bacterium]
MVFITPASSNSLNRLGRAASLCVLLLLPLSLPAAEFRISDVQIRLHSQVYLLDANIDYTFSPEALEALHNGVPLTIRIAINIELPRRWLWNETLANLEQVLRVQYHALSDQYVLLNLNSGARYAYHSRGAALEAMGRLRDFPLLDEPLLSTEQEYLVRLQARLDIESLPSPLRPIAYITPAWRLKSDWYQWSFTP